MNTPERVGLTVVLMVIIFVAGTLGIFSPMLGDDPRNEGVAVIALQVCAAVVLASAVGVVLTWWKW